MASPGNGGAAAQAGYKRTGKEAGPRRTLAPSAAHGEPPHLATLTPLPPAELLAAVLRRSTCWPARLVLDGHPTGGGPPLGLLGVDLHALAGQVYVGADHHLVAVGHGHPGHGVTPAMRTTAAGLGTTTSARMMARTRDSSVRNAAELSTSTVASLRMTAMMASAW